MTLAERIAAEQRAKARAAILEDRRERADARRDPQVSPWVRAALAGQLRGKVIA